MNAGTLLTWVDRNRWSARFSKLSLALAGLGLFLGLVAASMWQQWSLTFGPDPGFQLAASLSLAFSLWLGTYWAAPRADGTERSTPLTFVIGLGAWSLLHPFWIDTLTIGMKWLPVSWLENSFTAPVVALVVAALAWIMPGMLASALVMQVTQGPASSAGVRQANNATMLCGIACGLVLNSLVLSPRFGLFIPIMAACLILGLTIWRFGCVSSQRGVSFSESCVRHDTGVMVIRWGMVFLTGALLACHVRLANQLMPQGAFVVDVQLAGLFFGMAAGLFVASRLGQSIDRAAWGGVIAAVAASVILALQPLLVDLSLRMNATLTVVSLLLPARCLLLMALAFPCGFAWSWVADSNSNEVRSRMVFYGVPCVAGFALATYVMGGLWDATSVLICCVLAMSVAAAGLRIRTLQAQFSWNGLVATACLLLTAVSLPIWHHRDDAVRSAKLLFSAPAVIAYRTGWELKYLASLDDVRLLHRREGRTGPLTLWRGRVAELYVREAGIPRAVITNTADAVPQFSPEVLQAVYSLVIADRPGRVMLLGLSAGVPLSTCLSFPIREAVCVEGDSNLISLVRGELHRETGANPLADDRVTLRNVSPELALMAKPDESFDVILSCPPSSSLTSGLASYTTEYYQRAAQQLSERGVFCQRFEGIDFGPEPMLSVIQSMRESFRQLMAIETSAGDLLLFGTMCEDLFVPSDLAQRLEMPHVCRVLARSGMDWSALLNLPTFDHLALGEMCDDHKVAHNSCLHGTIAARAPMEVMRWGNKQQEVQAVLTATRVTPAPFWIDESGQPKELEEERDLSRRSRLVEWLGEGGASKELIRRLEEVTSQRSLVRENPDTHWWAYRRILKKQLQDRPRTAIQQVKAVDKKGLHPEDSRRRDYFEALGNAARRPKPTREQVAAVEQQLDPYDPLVSYFGRQETADLLARAGEDPARELMYRLHVIYFSPTVDASVRNVATAIQLLVSHPESIPDDTHRFDALNGMIQTLRVRWEVRQNIREDSSKKVMDDVDQSLLAVEKGLAAMNELAATTGISDAEWQTRKQVIERLMTRPLRTYRGELQARLTRGQAMAHAIIDEATNADRDLPGVAE
ncbi:spermidine synthase [Schlesneria paludicola]|uniref:spermidine synthase n=1 Tax=Schlesneria paludicola TaxID=360056 RepID=UPI00029A626C|nr:spermine synthase [Schlesneria paludicola]